MHQNRFLTPVFPSPFFVYPIYSTAIAPATANASPPIAATRKAEPLLEPAALIAVAEAEAEVEAMLLDGELLSIVLLDISELLDILVLLDISELEVIVAPAAAEVEEAIIEELVPLDIEEVMAAEPVVAPAAKEAGADAAQAHTAAAEDWTCRPVMAPQALTTHPRAAVAMAADALGLHWHWKSVAAQPTTEPADMIQEFYRMVVREMNALPSEDEEHKRRRWELWLQWRRKQIGPGLRQLGRGPL
ncbi:hypothetical protein MMC12_001313 [Toensbergia leucococca]|nr:hypothetical protein [Toensbergia leucococca]